MPNFQPFALPGTIHGYAPHLLAFEFSTASPPPKNTIIFISGLGDTLLGSSISRALANHAPLWDAGWGVIEIGLASAGKGWGVGSVKKDAEQLTALLHYLRPRGGHTVLIGHSTGSNDLIQLFTRSPALLNGSATTESLPLPLGICFLCPVSDREWVRNALPADSFSKALEVTAKMVADGRGEALADVPLREMGLPAIPVTARRWLSLTAALGEYPEGEDFFSSDASVEVEDSVWGELARQYGRDVHVISAGEDEFYFGGVTRGVLVERWKEAWLRAGGRGERWGETVVAGGDHSFTKDGTEGVMVEVVGGWVLGLEKELAGEGGRERGCGRPAV